MTTKKYYKTQIKNAKKKLIFLKKFWKMNKKNCNFTKTV